MAAVITGEVLVRVPALAETAAGTDARIDALADAPRWAGSLYLAIYSPLPEELIYRGLLLLVVGGYLARFRSASVRRVTVVLALVAMSTIFGMHHLGWSLLNAVSAGVHGLMGSHLWLMWEPNGSPVAYVEGNGFGELIDDADKITDYRLSYDRIRDLALSPSDSLAFVQGVSKEHQS